jgi:hypothetical protein
MLENGQNNFNLSLRLRRSESVWGNEYIDPRIHDLDTSMEWSVSRPDCFIHGERAPATHWIGGWVGPRTGMDDLERRKFLPLPERELRHLGRPARSQSLYQLR